MPVVVFVSYTSCVSTQVNMTSVAEMERLGMERIGSVSASFTRYQFLHVWSPRSIQRRAQAALLEEARRNFTGTFEVVNITVGGHFSPWQLALASLGFFGNIQRITATGDVVVTRGRAPAIGAGVEGALERAVEDVSRQFTARSRIAIVYVSAGDRATTEFITGELEHILLRRGFVIVDRSELDRIRAEQALGLGLEVDDSTAARIGHFAGASVVITGGVDGAGNLRRLRLRALDTITAQVIGTASEGF